MSHVRTRHRIVAIMHAAVGLLTLVGVWLGLPTRWAWVDVPATLLAFASLSSATALWLQRDWGVRLATWVTRIALTLGAITVTLLAWSVSQLAGQYGPVGGGGALLLGSIAALIVPYFIGLPLLQAWLLRESA